MQFKDMTGQRVPNVTFRTRGHGEWIDVTTDDIFKGKTVVVFSLPGAFTPTCSSTHVPRYEELSGALKSAGVDEIVCISVNDGFVMKEWAADQKAEHIRFIPDGNGTFTEGMGMLVDKDDLGFGKRSWRYSMLVKDGVVAKMFIEPVKEGDPFEVSDADTMLEFLSPSAKKPHSVLVFSREGCPYCMKAKAMLKEAGMRYCEVKVYDQIQLMGLRAVSGRETVPQVFIDGQHIGGSDDLEAYFAAKK